MKANDGKSVVGKTSLAGATAQLRKEHPEKYNDLGPHKGGQSHVTHMPLAGLKPSGSKGC